MISQQDPCLGADNGDVYATLCNLQSALWKRSFLCISVTASRGFLHNRIWACWDIRPQLKLYIPK